MPVFTKPGKSLLCLLYFMIMEHLYMCDEIKSQEAAGEIYFIKLKNYQIKHLKHKNKEKSTLFYF